MEPIASNTILFITGAFVGNNCWDSWKKYFEEKGYTTSAPPWPFKDASVTVKRFLGVRYQGPQKSTSKNPTFRFY
jgi:hypothetical protein